MLGSEITLNKERIPICKIEKRITELQAITFINPPTAACRHLSALVLGDGVEPPEDAKVFNGIYFFDTVSRIADWLMQLHGFYRL